MNIPYVDPQHMLYKFLATSSGLVEMNSSIAYTFAYTTPSSQTAYLHRINLMIVDSGIGFNEFGGLGSALSTGLELGIYDPEDNQVLDFMDGQSLVANEEWGWLAGVDDIITPVAGEDGLRVRFTFSKVTGDRPIKLEAGWSFRCIVAQNLDGITKFRIMLQGFTVGHQDVQYG